MLTKKLNLSNDKSKRHFNEEAGKYFPPAQIGMMTPHIPSKEERKNCGFAPENYDCKKETCKRCEYHHNKIKI